eukprot:14085806-Heterocapsa_arctica.AAC.1
MNFASASGLVDQDATADKGDVQEVELATLRVLKPRTSDEKPSGSKDLVNFNLFDKVTVSKRMTWVLPVEGPKGKKDFRKESQ